MGMLRLLCHHAYIVVGPAYDESENRGECMHSGVGWRFYKFSRLGPSLYGEARVVILWAPVCLAALSLPQC